MLVKLAQIGNSQGIRIPQAILREINFNQQAKLEIKNDKIVLTPQQKNRKGWNQQFKQATENQSKQNEKPLLPGHLSQSWDEENWQW